MSELRELKQLREENRKLKGLVADLTLDKQILRESLTKNSEAGGEAGVGAVGHRGLRGVAALRATGVASSTMHDKHRRPSQHPLRAGRRELAARVSYGYLRLYVLLRREGWRVNHKRVYRLYREEGLALQRRRPKRRRSAMPRSPRYEMTRPNERWAMDFMQDGRADGRTGRVFTLVDAYPRECLALEAAPRFRGGEVAALLSSVIAERGKPQVI